jgi:hypothetical protein
MRYEYPFFNPSFDPGHAAQWPYHEQDRHRDRAGLVSGTWGRSYFETLVRHTIIDRGIRGSGKEVDVGEEHTAAYPAQ